MPRPTRQQIDALPQMKEIGQRAEGTRVVARQVDTFVAPAQGEAQALMEGLAVFNPALQRYTAYRDLREEEAGAAARNTGAAKPESASDAWARGYMHMDNVVKGQQDGTKLLEAYDAWEGKDAGNVEEFISTQLGERTKGFQSSDLASYNRGLAPTLNKLRAGHLEYNRTQLALKAESNAMQVLEQGIRNYAAAGQPVPMDFIDGYGKELKSVMGVSGKKYNELVFGAMQRLGDEGNFAIYDVLKQPRADGTPGMYFIPEWKTKIDAAQIRATQVFVAKQEGATRLAKAQREERQETALFPVFDLLTSGKEVEARALFDQLRQDRTLFSRASDVTKYEALFDTTAKREANPMQQTNETNLLSDVYTGRANHDTIIGAAKRGDITNPQARSLIGQLSKIRSERMSAAAAGRSAEAAVRSAAAAERNAAKAIYDSPQYRMGEKFLSEQFRSGASPMDPFGVGTTFDRNLRANMRLRFAQEAANKQPHELEPLRQQIIHEATTVRDRMVKEVKTNPRAAGVRYFTEASAMEAARAGKLVGKDLEAHVLYYEQTLNQPSTTKP